MNIAFVGSRLLVGCAEVRQIIRQILNQHLLEVELVVSGGCYGPDTEAEKEAKAQHLPFKAELPTGPGRDLTWVNHFKPRNLRIIDHVQGPEDKLVAFLSKSSNRKTYGAGWTADEYERQTGKRAERYWF